MNPMDVFDYQMEDQPVGVITVKDGTVFLFTVEALESLLAVAKTSEQGKAVVFVKSSETV